MKYKIGDKVRFLNDVGGGIVSKIVNSNLVQIIDEDGFEIPVHASELVVVGQMPVIQNSSTVVETIRNIEKVDDSKPKIVNLEGDEYELLLAFVPQSAEIADSDIDIYFINDSSFYCMYSVSYWTKNNKLILLGRNDIEPETKEHVYTLKRTELNEKLNINITFFLYKHREYKIYPPEQINIELSPIKFVKSSSFSENDFFDEKAFIYKIATSAAENYEMSLDAKSIENAIKDKKDKKPKITQSSQRQEIEEIDLHIQELVDNSAGMENGQMVEIQIARFTTALDLGIRAGTKRMIFIHGVGNGKLKHEIRRLLDTQYAGKVRYQDASFKEYGYGATMVIL